MHLLVVPLSKAHQVPKAIRILRIILGRPDVMHMGCCLDPAISSSLTAFASVSFQRLDPELLPSPVSAAVIKACHSLTSGQNKKSLSHTTLFGCMAQALRLRLNGNIHFAVAAPAEEEQVLCRSLRSQPRQLLLATLRTDQPSFICIHFTTHLRFSQYLSP